MVTAPVLYAVRHIRAAVPVWVRRISPSSAMANTSAAPAVRFKEKKSHVTIIFSAIHG
jgi:hypothetical protein